MLKGQLQLMHRSASSIRGGCLAAGEEGTCFAAPRRCHPRRAIRPRDHASSPMVWSRLAVGRTPVPAPYAMQGPSSATSPSAPRGNQSGALGCSASLMPLSVRARSRRWFAVRRYLARIGCTRLANATEHSICYSLLNLLVIWFCCNHSRPPSSRDWAPRRWARANLVGGHR